MKKSYKIEVDCANCAQKMEDAANKVAGVASATVSFMTQKMKVEFAEGAPSFAESWQKKRGKVLFRQKNCVENTGKTVEYPFLWGKTVEKSPPAAAQCGP